MKKKELLELKNQVQQEIQSRKRINELLETELVQEFLNLSNVEVQSFDEEDIRGILASILSNFTITKTNGIYVCTGTFFTGCDINYEDYRFYTRKIDFDNPLAEYRTYCDIEDRSMKTAYMKKDDNSNESNLLVSEFEGSNIVLNPYNSSENYNGYYEVRGDFFATAIEKGQRKAKKIILERYPRM